jgi:hypothetical protein
MNKFEMREHLYIKGKNEFELETHEEWTKSLVEKVNSPHKEKVAPKEKGG